VYVGWALILCVGSDFKTKYYEEQQAYIGTILPGRLRKSAAHITFII
jgi:hypothetical protein